MDYANMPEEQVYTKLQEHLEEVSEIVTALSKCFVILVNGKGTVPCFRVIDMDATREATHG